MSKVIIGVYFAVLLIAVPCLGGSSTSPARLKNMQDRLARRETVVTKWDSEAKQQIYLSLAVGLLGLIVGLLQGSTNNWTRVLTVVLGFCVSAITLCTNKVYPADYRTLERSVDQATPIIEDLRGIISEFDVTQSPENQAGVENEFKIKCGTIDLIGEKILGVDPPSPEPSRISGGLLHVCTVYAQSQSTPPAWTSVKLQVDKTSTYFVGSGESKTLTEAKVKSWDDAVNYGAHWLRDGQVAGNQSQPSPQLLDLVKNTADVSDTWFSYDRDTGIYRYYMRLRLTRELRSADPTVLGSLNAPVASRGPELITLPNDSAHLVANTDVILLVKHIGFAPLSAKLYVLSGKPNSTDHKIEPYISNRAAEEKYVTRFKTSLHSCDGASASIDGYTVWCFLIEKSNIKRKIGKAQHLAVIKAEGQQIDISVVDFDDLKRSIQIEVAQMMKEAA